MDPTLDGSPVLGTACHVVHIPAPNGAQVDAFFGVTGLATLYGGGRGRMFEVTGCFFDTNLSGVLAQEATLLSYADGIARVFTDTQGRVWPQVVFQGEYQASPEGPRPAADQGWILPYRCRLMGLL